MAYVKLTGKAKLEADLAQLKVKVTQAQDKLNATLNGVPLIERDKAAYDAANKVFQDAVAAATTAQTALTNYKEPAKPVKPKSARQTELDRQKGLIQSISGGTTDTGDTSGTIDTGGTDLITQTNAALAELAKQENATNYIYSKSGPERKALANQLKLAGYKVPVTEAYSSALVDVYRNALSDAQNENIYNKSIKGYIPNTLDSFLVYKTGLTSGTGGSKTTIDVTNLSDVNAVGYIDAVFQSELKRKATAEEIKALTPALKAYVKSNPTRTTRGTTTSTTDQGANPQDWLIQVIRGQQPLVGFNPKDKKQAATVAKANSVIATLGQEYQTKQSQDIATYATDVLKTIRSNGLDKLVGQDQIQAWAKRIKNGESQDIINAEVRNIAKTGMPDNIKKMLDSGTNLDTIYSPYKQAMSAILEINPETISLNDPVLRSAIKPEGEVSIYDFQRSLRKDPRWEYTNNARDEVSSSVTQVLKDFGFKG